LDWIWLRIEISGGLLWTRYWTFGFRKMLGSSWGAAQLDHPKGGLSSVSEWVIVCLMMLSVSQFTRVYICHIKLYGQGCKLYSFCHFIRILQSNIFLDIWPLLRAQGQISHIYTVIDHTTYANYSYPCIFHTQPFRNHETY
jgi:hypothetical protein